MNRKMGDIRDVATAPSQAEPRDLRAHAHQQVDAGDAQGIKESDVEVVGLDRPEAGDLGNDGGAVAQGGRIDVVEARAGVPQRLPLRMRPVLRPGSAHRR